MFLGGVSNCGEKSISECNYIEWNQTVDITLCGNPQPELFYTLDGEQKKYNASVVVVDDSQKMFKYNVQLDNLKISDCKKTIYFYGKGFKDYKIESKIIMPCKHCFSVINIFSIWYSIFC